MTLRFNPAPTQNAWSDAQRVSLDDLDTEQNYNNDLVAAVINNQFGSGVLLSSPQQAVLFNSDQLNAGQAALLASHNFDGTGILPTQQPSDNTLGNQLEIELSDSLVFGRLSVKVAIIGITFDGSLQMDRLTFYRNEKQVTAQHYKVILAFFFNDFQGNTLCSRSNGGQIVIRETSSFELSRAPIMVAQDVEPDIFWRDWKPSSLNPDLFSSIQIGIGSEYNANDLQINVNGQPPLTLLPNDVVSQVGQKFFAATNNIQKITLLLGVSANAGVTEDLTYDWAGDLLITVSALQTSVSSPSDIVPNLAIDFDPSPIPLAQLSYNQASFRDMGYVLTDVLQPVDFVFNNTRLGSATTSGLIPGNYYVVTVSRVGAPTAGTILLGCGGARLLNSRVTVFGGTWVDITQQDLWFQVWTDAVKVSDGLGYDAGKGTVISKTAIDSNSGATVDYSAGPFSFSDAGKDIVNTVIIQALPQASVPIASEKTGSPVNSRQKLVPSISLVTNSTLTNLKHTSEPLMIGAIQDTNPKQNPTLTKLQVLPGLAKGDTFTVINPDADLLSLNLLGSKLIPNTTSCGLAYKIFRVTLCTDGYGDVNGDGIIDASDIAAASALLGEGVYSTSSQQKMVEGELDLLHLLRADVDGDGYITANDIDLITNYVNRVTNSFAIGSTFSHLNLEVQMNIGRFDSYFDCDGYIRLDGYQGQDIIPPNTLDPAQLIYDGYLSTPQLQIDPVFTTVPFPGVLYQIVPQPFWQPYLLAITSQVRLVPASFTGSQALVPADCNVNLIAPCQDRNQIVPSFDPGRNDFFVPDNLYLGRGQLLRLDGSNYKIDYEIGTIILQLPQIPLAESAIDVFHKFVMDRGDGKTSAGYAAMRYSDCTTVQPADLILNRVKFEVAIQSFVSNLDGYSILDGYGIIVDPIAGVYLDQATGILKLTIKDLLADQVYLTLITKLQITVHLKKAGFVNTTLIIEPSEIAGLISS